MMTGELDCIRRVWVRASFTFWTRYQHEPHTLGVDIQPRQRGPGKVSRTVSASPLMLDMTVMCTSVGDGSAAGDSYSGCSASGHRGQCYGCCQYEHAVRCASGSSGGEAWEAGPRVFDRPAVEVTRVSSVIQYVVLVGRAHAAAGISEGFVAALFARPCSGGTFAGSSGRG